MNLKWIGTPLRLQSAKKAECQKGTVPKSQSANQSVTQWVGPNLIFIQDSDEGTV